MLSKINGFSQSLVNYAFDRMTEVSVVVDLSAKAVGRVFEDLESTLSAFADLALNQVEISEFAIKNAIEDLRAHNAQEIIDSINLEDKAHETMSQLLALINKFRFDISLV